MERASAWNWAGGSGGTVPGRGIAGALNGEATATTHATDAFNRIGSLVQSGGAGGSSTTPYVYDRAGNLACDDEFFYQYDAWNRLLQISLKGSLTFDSSGEITGGLPGDWLVHFTYDGLGRLTRRQTPWPQAGVGGGGNQDKRFEHFYYDGVRRVAEVFTDPLPAGDGDGGASSEEEEEEPPGPTTYTWTEREYVWGPGYVDELVCQLGGGESPASQQAARYAVLDANYNVVALVGGQAISSGGSLTSVPGGWGSVLEQYAYDPYGSVLLCDTLVSGGTSADPSLPRNRVGHQGLFADRFDAPTGAAQLAPGARLVYHNRNRILLAPLGRYAQFDPNGLSLYLLEAVAFHGEGQPSRFSALIPSAMYADGLAGYGYLGSSPPNHRDPSGLFLGLVAMVLPMAPMDLYLDYNAEAISSGLTMGSYVEGSLDNYGIDQLDAAEAVLSWDAPDEALAAMGVGGLAIAHGLRNHHVIPRFLLGIDDAANRLRLPRADHDLFHRTLEAEFKSATLNPPNARGAENWRRRLMRGEVSQKEINRAREALMKAARTFDQLTNNAHDLARRVRIALTAGFHLPKLSVGRRRRLGG